MQHTWQTSILKIIFVALVLLSVFYLRWRADLSPPPPLQPLDFKLVKERYRWVLTKDITEVEELLGPPDSEQTWEPDFYFYEAQAAARPDRYPNGGFSWLKWSDQTNQEKWVAVFFVGNIACHVVKKGF
jgi:hypothetical protein